MNSDEEERTFKHYLYVLDGILCRCKRSSYYIKKVNDGRLEEDEFIAFTAQIKDIDDSDIIAKNFIIQQLKSSSLYRNDKIINRIIEYGNWRYESLNPSEKKGKNQLNWGSLYEKVDSNRNFSTYASYLSVFVHGLSISNFDLGKSDGLFEPILSLSIINLDLASKAVEQIYGEDIDHYNIDFKKSQPAKILCYSVSDEYLQELIKKRKTEHPK